MMWGSRDKWCRVPRVVDLILRATMSISGQSGGWQASLVAAGNNTRAYLSSFSPLSSASASTIRTAGALKAGPITTNAALMDFQACCPQSEPFASRSQGMHTIYRAEVESPRLNPIPAPSMTHYNHARRGDGCSP